MKKGFTLIELLAVIVILAIIALIATPMILGVIDSAKKGAAESSTYGYIDAIEKSDLKNMIDTGDYQTKKDGTYDLSTLTDVVYKGTAPTAVCVVIKEGSVESGEFKFDNYIVDYQNGKAKVNNEKTEVSCEATPTPENEVGFDTTKGVNKPQLSSGMIPIKWNGSDWVTTDENDSDWYDYANKKWANMATIDKTKVIDYSGNKNIGSIAGATQQEDGFYFDGIDDYISVSNQLKNYNFNNSISLTVRFNMKTINKSNDRAIFGNWENGGGGISINKNNSIDFKLYIGGSYRLVQSIIKIEANKYYTIVGTYDGSQMKLYINGQLDNTFAISGNILASTVSFGVAANPNSSSYVDYSDAIISDIGIYKTALTDTQISTNFCDNVNFIKENSLLIYNFKNENNFNNTIIDINNINTMWVWIPRYAYKITSGYHSSTTGTIDLKFLKGTSDTAVDNTKVETTGYVAGTKDTSMHYFTHSAFQNDINQLGYWVAKFEPTAVEGVVNGYYSNWSCPITGDNVSTKTIKVVPNTTSWRCINNKNAYNASIAMKTNEIYGWQSSSVDTHIATNLEWGAVYYLTLSKYGANTDEVYINNSQTYTTGCAGNTASASSYNGCQNIYNTETGVKASTTQNITGIYDMSGGSWEKTMAVYNNLMASSGFTIAEYDSIPSYHITKYTVAGNNMLNGIGMNYDATIYGDGVYETSAEANRWNGTTWSGTDRGGWGTEYSYLPYTSGPWFYRGTIFNSTSLAGIGGFYAPNGGAYSDNSFRPIVSVIK